MGLRRYKRHTCNFDQRLVEWLQEERTRIPMNETARRSINHIMTTLGTAVNLKDEHTVTYSQADITLELYEYDWLVSESQRLDTTIGPLIRACLYYVMNTFGTAVNLPSPPRAAKLEREAQQREAEANTHAGDL